MCIAKDGTAIILGEVVPPLEVKVLRTLACVNMEGGLTVHELCTQCKATSINTTEPALATLLKRLQGRGLVTRDDRILNFHGGKYRRVFWKEVVGVLDFFQKNDTTQE